MMKKTIAIACLLAATFSEGNAQNWAPVKDKILTPWAEQVTPQNAHREYPRPQLARKNNWQNLNGLWKYKITNKDQKDIPSSWDGDILVPFAVESALSGKKIALFGSYGWGDGQWMRDWEDRCKSDNANLVTDSVIANNAPSDDDLENCSALGRAIA